MFADTDEIQVADSFRVRLNPESGAAEVRGFDRHLFRFSRAVHQICGGTLANISQFLDHSAEQIAKYGEGFPRLELQRENQLKLSLRPLPELRETIELRTTPFLQRSNTEIKGPNIAAFAQLNRALQAEAVLLDLNGNIVEGTTTSLIWWKDGQLHRVVSGGRVPSVTESLLANIAKATGIEIVRESISPSELLAHEVWALNALHGIRPVTSLDGNLLAAPAPEGLNAFRTALDATWQPVKN